MNVLGTSLEVVGGSMSFPSSSVFGFFSPRLYSELLESCEGPGKPEPVVSRGWSVAPVVGGGCQGPNKGKRVVKKNSKLPERLQFTQSP